MCWKFEDTNDLGDFRDDVAIDKDPVKADDFKAGDFKVADTFYFLYL